MADSVQHEMERMIPELNDLKEKRLFDNDEIHQIITRRREFEYMLKRNPLRPIDGLRYIEYEMNLNALRKLRKKRLGMKKFSVSEVSMSRRIESIFDRILYKQRGSIDLWLQYIEYCKAEGNKKKLCQIFSRALQFHPRAEEIWIEAANFEFEVNLNIDSARILMQRAIRLNTSCHRLWHEYFRLELLFIQQISLEKKLHVFENVTDDPDSGNTLKLMESTEEFGILLPDDQNGESKESITTDMEPNSHIVCEIVSSGAIPRIVFMNAIKTIQDDIQFRLQFITIADNYSFSFVPLLTDWILQICAQDFPDNEDVHFVKAISPLKFSQNISSSIETLERQVLNKFDQSMLKLKSNDFNKRCADWISSRLVSENKSPLFGQFAEAVIRKYVTGSNGMRCAELTCVYIQLIQTRRGVLPALKAAKCLLENWSVHPPSGDWADLWLLYLQLLTSTPDHERHRMFIDSMIRPTVESKETSYEQNLVEITRNVLSIGIMAVSTRRDHFMLYDLFLKLLMSSVQANRDDIESVFAKAMRSQIRDSELWCTFRDQYLRWMLTTCDLQSLQSAITRFLDCSPRLDDKNAYQFLVMLIDMLTSSDLDETEILVTNLFEKLINTSGRRKEEVWTKYWHYFASRGLLVRANSVLQRALKSIPNSEWLQKVETSF